MTDTYTQRVVERINELGDALKLSRTITTDDAVARTREAAALISRQREEIERLREALTKISTLRDGYWEELFDECQTIALAALEATK